MKKTAAFALIIMMFTLMLSFSLADGIWTCPNCHRTGNDGNYCPKCAFPCPDDSSWDCPRCGVKGNTDNFCPNCREPRPKQDIWALAIDRLSINDGPGTKRYFKEIGTFRVKGQYVRVFAKSYDTDNDIWWIQCEIPDSNQIGWTGLKRFDQSTFDLDALPIVVYDRTTRRYVY